MNTHVYKYPLTDKVLLPKNAQILKIGWQKKPSSAAFIWALIDPEEKETDERTFQLVLTGEGVVDNNLLVKVEYIDTIFCFTDGLYILHVFENKKIT